MWQLYPASGGIGESHLFLSGPKVRKTKPLRRMHRNKPTPSCEPLVAAIKSHLCTAHWFPELGTPDRALPKRQGTCRDWQFLPPSWSHKPHHQAMLEGARLSYSQVTCLPTRSLQSDCAFVRISSTGILQLSSKIRMALLSVAYSRLWQWWITPEFYPPARRFCHPRSLWDLSVRELAACIVPKTDWHPPVVGSASVRRDRH